MPDSFELDLLPDMIRSLFTPQALAELTQALGSERTELMKNAGKSDIVI